MRLIKKVPHSGILRNFSLFFFAGKMQKSILFDLFNEDFSFQSFIGLRNFHSMSILFVFLLFLSMFDKDISVTFGNMDVT